MGLFGKNFYFLFSIFKGEIMSFILLLKTENEKNIFSSMLLVIRMSFAFSTSCFKGASNGFISKSVA